MRARAVVITLVLAGLAVGAAGCDQPGDALSVATPTPVVPGPAGLEAFLDCLSDEGVTLVDAHRGGPAPGYPENAIATLAHTLSRAPATLEIDIGVTRDGVLVLMHDDDLDRTSTCQGPLVETDFADLAECRLQDNDGAVTGFPIPTLAEALAWGEGRTILRLDVKRSVAYEDVVNAIRAAGAEDRVAVITYDAGGAARLARLAPELVINSTIYGRNDLDDHEERGLDLDQLVAWTGTNETDPTFYAALDALGVPVIFGTLGDPSRSVDGAIERTGDEGRYREIAEEGADIIATDRPIEAYESLREERDPALALEACRSAS